MPLTKKMKVAIITSETFIACVYRFIRLYSATFRLTVENERPWMDHLSGGGRVLLCCWHQQFMAAIRHFKKYEPYRGSLMISRSSDGELIAGIARRSGFYPVRGSSSRGGREALGEMIDKLRETGFAGHILDGPTGADRGRQGGRDPDGGLRRGGHRSLLYERRQGMVFQQLGPVHAPQTLRPCDPPVRRSHPLSSS